VNVIRPREITGIQVHHSVNLADASRFGVNALTALEAARQRRDDPELEALLAALRPLVRRASALGAQASARMVALHEADSRRFRSARDGREPWPDERVEGFVARCSCADKCLVHDQGLGTPDDCNCGPCVRHKGGT
jgi:hypothetical protein